MVLPEVQLRAEKLGAPGWVIGLILTSTFVIQIATSPSWGRLSDQIGRKPVLAMTTALSGMGLLLYGFAGSLWIILASRMLSGLGGANVAAAQAALADLTPADRRTEAMGRLGAVVSGGLIAGPALGALVALNSPQVSLGIVAGCASLLGAALIIFGLPNPKPTEIESATVKSRRPGLALLGEIPTLKPLFLVCVTAWLALAILEGTFGRLLERNFHQGVAAYSGIFAYESLLGILIQGFLLGWVSKRMGGSPLLWMAFVLAGIGLAFTPFAPSISLIVVASTVYAVGAGLSNPTLNALASEATPTDRQGELFGLLQGARSVGFIIGPLVGGALFDFWAPGPYVTAGVACLVACFLVPNWKPSSIPVQS
jgi:MFS family permease